MTVQACEVSKSSPDWPLAGQEDIATCAALGPAPVASSRVPPLSAPRDLGVRGPSPLDPASYIGMPFNKPWGTAFRVLTYVGKAGA